GISLLLARTLIRPMEQLEQGIKTISRGDLDCRVKVSSPDLVGSMAAAVNDMAPSLAKSRDALKHSLTELAKKEKMAALGQLTAGIAHEIKNPLGIIQGSAEIMMDDSKPLAMRKQAARFVIDEVDRLNRTITEFFAFARPPEPVFRRADLQAILEETLARCSEPCSGQGVVVELSPPAAPRFCAVDPDLVHQVFMNLILNALASMPDGGTLRCRIEERVPAATGGPGWLAVEFSDTGEGIDPEHLEQIFEPFVSFRDQGIGLGLSVVRQIITIHHGKIDVHSIPGQGTTFTLLFPLDPDDGTGQDRQERR
ncbi:MAG TPA: HAMP domain-containing sensor histidine kinase, partial [Desulfobulbus sp.]|nr:HAMP domain-containing sensor histidine kinase [Desulfobulbus sp.]